MQARYKINEGKKDFSNIESRLLYSTIIVQRSRNDLTVIRFTVSSFSIRSSVLNDPRDNDNIRIIDRGSFRISYTYTVYTSIEQLSRCDFVPFNFPVNAYLHC